MSSFPKHSFEQAYDHAFPPSPPTQHATLPTVSERSPLITKAPSTLSETEQLLGPNNLYTSNHGTASSSTTVNGDGHHIVPTSDDASFRSDSTLMTTKELTIHEFKILLKYSGPVVLTYVLQNSLQLASLISLGHLGSIGKLFTLVCS